MKRSTLTPQALSPGLKEIVLKGILNSALQPSAPMRAAASQMPSQLRLALPPKASPSPRAPRGLTEKK